MKVVIALLLIPALAGAGARYDFAVRPVDDSMAQSGASLPPKVTQYFVDDGKVRVGGATATMVYLFKDRTLYVIDNPARIVHVLKHATLAEVTAHYADAVKQLETAAANAPPQDRPAALQKAADMKAASERLLTTVPRDYRMTTRFESVDGRACRVWEEWEHGAKRLELCVAQIASIPGGADILKGIKTLSQFRQGSDFAFGVEFGLDEWWPDFTSLGGVPILVREYKYDSVISEAMLTSMQPGGAAGALWDTPTDYQIQEGPDYSQWYLR